MAKENRTKGAFLSKSFLEPSLSAKGCVGKAMETHENVSKPVQNEHRHLVLVDRCADRDRPSEGCIDREFPLHVHPFPRATLRPNR